MLTLPPLSSAPSTRSLAGLRARNAGQAEQTATLAEVFPETAVDGAATGFVLAQLHGVRAPVLWVQDRLSRREAGRPCLAGLDPALRLILVEVSKPIDVLWTLEEALGSGGLAAAVGEIWGDPPTLDFTATKRLALRAEARGRACHLIRRAGSADLSAARLRWRVASLPAEAVAHDMRAPGQPLWRVELFRARWRAPGSWVARHDPVLGLIFDHGREDVDEPPQRARA